MSTLGYALLPMLILGGLGIIFTLKGTLGILISLSIAFWSSLAAGNTLEVYLREPHNNRRVLIIYPLFLFYLCFAMIVIFWQTKLIFVSFISSFKFIFIWKACKKSLRDCWKNVKNQNRKLKISERKDQRQIINYAWNLLRTWWCSWDPWISFLPIRSRTWNPRRRVHPYKIFKINKKIPFQKSFDSLGSELFDVIEVQLSLHWAGLEI